MQRLRLTALSLAVVMISASVMGVGQGTARATLEGENGTVVYVTGGPEELVLQDGEADANTAVVTTDSSGQNETTVVENVNDASFITAATISAPNSTGTHTIAYAETELVCDDYEEEDWEENEFYSEGGCADIEYIGDGYFTSDVTIRTVTVDQNGQPNGEAEDIVTINAPDTRGSVLQSVQHISFSPDSTNIVETRLVLNGKVMAPLKDQDDECFGFCMTFEQVMLDDGTINTIVPFRFDPYLNGGYGQNGNIYYSMSDEEYEGYGEEGAETVNVDIWYIPSGGPLDTAYQVTDTDEIDEVFVDALPDDTKLLVWDARSQQYYYVLLDDCLAVMTSCSVVLVEDVPENIELVGVSPDGTSFYGTQYPEFDPLDEMITRSSFISVMEAESPGTILALRSAISTASTVNNLMGVQDWAPKFVQPVTIVQGTSTTTSTVAKLSNTGANSTSAIFVLMTIVALAGITVLPRKN